MTKTKAQKTYEYLRNKLLREARRGGLTEQEEKLIKFVDTKPSKLDKKETQARANKLKAEFKRIRQTKKYKEARKQRNEFYKELKKFETYELLREARRRLQNLPPAPDQLQGAYFKNMTYSGVRKKGITRRENDKVVRYTGKEAVKKQIESFKLASNPDLKKKRFIETYREQLELNGVPDDYTTEVYIEETGEYKTITRRPVDEMIEYLESLDPKKISFLLDVGLLADITFYYIWSDSDTEAFIKKLDYLKKDEAKIEARYQQDYANEFKLAKLIKKERALKNRSQYKVNGVDKMIQF